MVRVRDMALKAIDAERHANAEAAQDQVPCTQCSLAYGLRHTTGCRVEGEAHVYEDAALGNAYQRGWSTPVEYARLPVTELFETLGLTPPSPPQPEGSV